MSGYEKFFKEAKKATGSSTKEGFKLSLEKERVTPKQDSRVKKGRSATNSSRSMSSKRTSAMSPEEQLRQVLAERVRERQKARKRRIVKRQKFPAFPVFLMTVTLIGCGIGYFAPERMEFVLKHVDVGFLGRATAAPTGKEKTNGPQPAEAPKENHAATSVGAEEKSSAGPANIAEEKVPDIRGWTSEELSFFNKLNERKKELDRRESQLNQLEEELQRQKLALDEKIKQLKGMREQISQTLKTRVANDQEKVNKLVEFYSSMKPQQAAKVIETINEDLAVEVLDKMKKNNAAEIMNMMDAKKARRLSEILTGYQRFPASGDKAGEKAESQAPPVNPVDAEQATKVQ